MIYLLFKCDRPRSHLSVLVTYLSTDVLPVGDGPDANCGPASKLALTAASSSMHDGNTACAVSGKDLSSFPACC